MESSMPATCEPVLSRSELDRLTLSTQDGFVVGYTTLAELARRLVVVPTGKRCTADAISLVVCGACNAVQVASQADAMIETDEDFSPLENRLADTVIALMAVSKVHDLRVAQCVASKLAATVDL
jgi:hypothetical protein